LWLLVIELAALGAAVLTLFTLPPVLTTAGLDACTAHQISWWTSWVAVAVVVVWLWAVPPQPWRSQP
jgi:hypothetical protein